MVVSKQEKIPELIIYTYIAFLKNFDKVATALANYYTEPTGIGRMRLIQEIAKPQTGAYSEKINKANKVVEQMLDLYNSTQPIACIDTDWIDVDLDNEIEQLLAKNNPIIQNPHHPFKRINNV